MIHPRVGLHGAGKRHSVVRAATSPLVLIGCVQKKCLSVTFSSMVLTGPIDGVSD